MLDQTIEILAIAMPHLDQDALVQLRTILQKKLPPTNADNAPGLVPNVMTGRIANRLNLHGPNYLLDAACSSSLLAVGAAIDELRSGRSRMMLAGGVNATLPADVTTIFTQLGALSARGKVRPFAVGSDGTLLGEGLGVIVLKRATMPWPTATVSTRWCAASVSPATAAAPVCSHPASRARRWLSAAPTRRPASIRRRSAWSRRTVPASRWATRPRSPR